MIKTITVLGALTSCASSLCVAHAATPAQLYPLSDVRLLPSPFADAVAANRKYLLELDPDRLMAPFYREAGLTMKKPPYANWESQGLDGHTAGHYLSALADMIASGNDKDGELNKRLDYMLSEMEKVQQANGNGYIGGVPDSKELWKKIAAGNVSVIFSKWVPWYNVHKTYAGLRDSYNAAGKEKAHDLLVKFGDWAVNVTSGLSDSQMQQMLGQEYGGMNEVMADIYTITGDKKYLVTAERFNHHAIIDPLMNGEDKLTGLHANTQIPKIVGLETIATLNGNQKEDFGARFFWDTVTKNRSIAIGGNSVSEHFNDPKDFSGMLKHREGPETCNTYNMLRLTEKLFASKPEARYVDFYERALYNHILSTIDRKNPGFVYFTPIRPQHYRVYSEPHESFWCCVGTGMENPGRYGQFVYAKDNNGGIYVNLFMPSVLKAGNGITIQQDNKFPYEARTKLSIKSDKPASFSLYLRHPSWVPEGKLSIRVNGRKMDVKSKPSSYATLTRNWKNGDTVEVDLPMNLAVEPLPDGSNWAAIEYGPIVLAADSGSADTPNVRANNGRMAHVAGGAMIPLDQVPCLLTNTTELLSHIVPDPKSGPLHFRIKDVAYPAQPNGIELQPFFDLREVRYQMYWELASKDDIEKRKEKLAADERAKAARELATFDVVNPGEQQSEVEHNYKGEASGTGLSNGRRWRDGRSIEYTLNTKGAEAADLSVTYWGGDSGRTFDIFADSSLIATEQLKAEKPNSFIERRYVIPKAVLAAAKNNQITIKFTAKQWTAGGLFEVRLLKSGTPLIEVIQ